MSFIKTLQSNIYKVTDGYFANWTPDLPITVGDYGYIKKYRFTKDDNINALIQSLIQKNRFETATLEKKSGVRTQTQSSASTGSVLDKATLNLKFAKEGAFLYHLKDLTNFQYQNRREVFEKLCKLILLEKDLWRDDYVLVTEVKQAGRALILVADTAEADMSIEYEIKDSETMNLASAIGKIGYTLDSDRVIKYEIQENSSVLFRVVSFDEGTSGDGPSGPISRLKERIIEWYDGDLPKPESIRLQDYTEKENMTIGTFEFKDSKSVTICQSFENIHSFIKKSEKNSVLVLEV